MENGSKSDSRLVIYHYYTLEDEHGSTIKIKATAKVDDYSCSLKICNNVDYSVRISTFKFKYSRIFDIEKDLKIQS